jgi:hypothetical protein
MKLQYGLPAAQMVLVVLLLSWNNSLYEFARGRCDMPGQSPADGLLISLNAPLVLQLSIWNYSFSYPWNRVLETGAVGLFWYWVALNISSYRRGESMLTFSWKPARFALNVVLILLGLAIGLLSVARGREALRFWTLSCYSANPWFGWPLSTTVACIYLGWSLILIVFCGRDLIQSMPRLPA